MIKMIGVVAPRQGMSDQHFHDHWRHPHGTYVMQINLVRGYVQCHCIDSAVVGPNLTGFAGVAELNFDSIEESQRFATHPTYLNYNLADEHLFLDRDRLKLLFATEEVIQGGRDGPDVPMADYDWSDHNRPLAVKLLQFIQADGSTPWSGSDDADLGYRIGAFRHVRSHPIDEGDFLGVRELFWPTLTAFETGVRSDPDAFAALRDRPERSFMLLTQTERVV